MNRIDEVAEKNRSLSFSYDAPNDLLIIEGVKYSGELFRSLGIHGMAVGRTFRIKERSNDGVLVIENVDDFKDKPRLRPIFKLGKEPYYLLRGKKSGLPKSQVPNNH